MSNPINMKRYIYESFLDFQNETSISSIINSDIGYGIIDQDNNIVPDIVLAFSTIDSSSTSSGSSSSNINNMVPNGYIISNPFQRGAISSSMNINTKFSPDLLTLYFKACLSDIVLPSLRSEPLVGEQTADNNNGAATVTTTINSYSTIPIKGVVNRLIGANFWNM